MENNIIEYTDTTDTEETRQRWFIDLDWFQPNNRSFSTLAQGCLCPECRKRLEVEEGEVSAAALLATIRDCCSKVPNFITLELPVLESVFRFFLANGNQPLDLVELGTQLSDRRGGDIHRTSVEVLSRLLENDHYYGIRPIEE